MPTGDGAVMTEVSSPSMVLVPADLASVAVVRAAVAGSLAERGWDHDTIHRVVLATSEATANAVEHGSLPGELVEVLYHVGSFEAAVCVHDSGGVHAWHPPAVIPMAAPTASRGRGLAMMASLADDMTFSNGGRGVEVRMEFIRST